MKQVIFSAMKFTAILSVAAFAHIPAAAEAGKDRMGLHVGAGPAFVKIGNYCNEASAAGASCDDSAIGLKVFGNYRFTENFGVEGGYMWAEGFDVKGQGGGWETTASAFYIAGEAAYAFEGGFGIFAKAGVNFWEYEVDANTVIGSFSGDTDGTDPLFGVGAEYRHTPTSPLKFRAEWLRLLQEDEGADYDTDVISLTAGYTF